MVQGRDGKVVTFYSFKGGTGRTMALANVAWLLASSGKRVLAVDWDLESPGLYRYFNPFLSDEAVRDLPGVIDLIREFDTEAERRTRRGDEFTNVADYARVRQYAMSLNWDFPNGGGLDYMSSGRQNTHYAETIGGLGWDNFYDKLKGRRLFDALRADMKDNYDYTFIDSRTGYGDIADICTKQLPDTLVNCFTLNTQGIEGAGRVLDDLKKYGANGTAKRIKVLPVPMRVDDGEKEKADTGRSLARRTFAGLPANLTEQERLGYWSNVEIPYRPFYAYEEILAAFGDDSAGPTRLLGAYERLTGYITEGAVESVPPIETALRERWLKQFLRSAPTSVDRILLEYEPEDEAWAEWIDRVLGAVGIATQPLAEAASTASGAAAPLTLTVVSKFSHRPDVLELSELATVEPVVNHTEHDNRLALYVSDVTTISSLRAAASESVAGRSADEAVQRITKLVGSDPVPKELLPGLVERYPDNVPRLNNALSRNPRFTGRAELLRELRTKLRKHRYTAVIPDKLPSGVGKTQLALEYVHRYRSEYDVIWWVESGQPTFVDISMVNLGRLLNTQYDGRIPIDSGGTATDDALAVTNALAQGNPVKRWLLVLDNAPHTPEIRKFIPNGSGHVLITSRNPNWGQTADSSVVVGVFDRQESIAHLRWRAASVSEEDAGELAKALGDLPVAVSLTGAWLFETGTTAREYLRQLEARGPMAIPEPERENPLDGYSDAVVASLDASLDSVRDQSPAAYRLLELCSFLSEESISLDVVYTPPMRQLLVEFDADLTEHGDIARHVQLLNRLALIKLDGQTRQFTIHRLLHVRVRQRLSAESYVTTRNQVHTLLADNRPTRGVDAPDTWAHFEKLWPHLAPSDAARSGEERVRALMIDRVRYLWSRAELEATASTAREIETQWQAMLDAAVEGENTEVLRKQLLQLRFNVANILRDQAQYDEAWKLDTRVLDEQRELLGRTHRLTLMTAGGLAADLRALGRYQEAQELAEETYKTWRDVYGDDHERTLSAANNLAVSYRLTGRFVAARTLDEDTYDRRRAHHLMGPNHPLTISSANAIGRDMREAGEYQRSAGWLADVLKTASGQGEPSKRAVAQVQVNLGASLRAVGRFADAAPVLAAARGELDTLFGPDHAETLVCRLCVCANLQAAEQYEEADADLREVLDAYQRLVGRNHPLTLVAASNRVALLRSLNQFAQALNIARDTAERLLTVLGDTHPYTLAAQMNLAVCLADSGRLEEARGFDELSVRHLTRQLGKEHPDALRAAANLALTRRDLGEPGALNALSAAVSRLEDVIGRDHPSVVALRAGTRNHRVLDPQPF